MPSPTNELSPNPPTAPLPETPTEALNPKPPNENLNVNECDLSFREQCEIVWDGLKKGIKYDGCTGVPDFNFGKDCCGEHDYYYQTGLVSRAEADRRLRNCLRKKGYFVLPWVYYLGVRLLGSNYYKGK